MLKAGAMPLNGSRTLIVPDFSEYPMLVYSLLKGSLRGDSIRNIPEPKEKV
jgi:hypothetical protein